MTEHQSRERFHEIPPQVREIALNNRLIRSIMDAYVAGVVITREEMLCRMVVELAKDWHKQREDYIQLIRLSSIAIQPPGATCEHFR